MKKHERARLEVSLVSSAIGDGWITQQRQLGQHPSGRWLRPEAGYDAKTKSVDLNDWAKKMRANTHDTYVFEGRSS